MEKCDLAMKEADTYRQQYQLTKDKMEHRTGEYHIIKTQYKVCVCLFKLRCFDQLVADAFLFIFFVLCFAAFEKCVK